MASSLLRATPPFRQVVRWLSVCGNGKVEGLEECDDGGNEDGNGCSHDCRVEPGWECTRTSPSQCWRSGERPPGVPVDPRSGGEPSGGGGGGGYPPSGGGSTHHKAGRVAAIVISCLVAVGVGEWKRDAVEASSAASLDLTCLRGARP